MDHPNFGWFYFLANRVVTILDYKYYIVFLSSNTLKSRGSKLNHLHLSHLLTMWMWLVGSVAPQNKNNGKKNPQFFFFLVWEFQWYMIFMPPYPHDLELPYAYLSNNLINHFPAKNRTFTSSLYYFLVECVGTTLDNLNFSIICPHVDVT